MNDKLSYENLKVGYSKATVAVLIAMIIFVLIISLKNELFIFGGLLVSFVYLNLAIGIKTLSFQDDQILIKYPFRPFLRLRYIRYESVKKMYCGNGHYLDGSILILIYFVNRNRRRKLVLNYPGNEKWEFIQNFLRKRTRGVEFQR